MDDFSQQHTERDDDSLTNYNRYFPSQPFIIYVVCDLLKNGIGNALIDTGSQVSLVTAESLTRWLKMNKQGLKIHGITGNVMETNGYVDLCIGETAPHKFLVIEELPMDCEVLLGQDCLERFGCQIQIPSLGMNITLPAYSETVVRIPTTENGSRFIEEQELQEKCVFCIQCSRMH